MGRASRRTIARVVASRLADGRPDNRTVMRELGAYLVGNGMADEADVVINDIAEELFELTGRLVVEVRSAHPLTIGARQQLIRYFQDETGAKSVELSETVDESLIGGLIARTPSSELDVSIRTTLRQLRALT